VLLLPDDDGAELDSKLNWRVFCSTGVGCSTTGALSFDVVTFRSAVGSAGGSSSCTGAEAVGSAGRCITGA
jgi:hypothetical protein